MLTEISVWVFSQRTVLFEIKAYKATDDTMSRDLFQRHDRGWLTDPAVHDPLHSGRLHRPEGSVRRPATIAGDEREAHAKLLARYQVLEEEYAEREEFANEIEVASDNFEARPLYFDANEQSIARAGDFVTVDHRGELSVYPRYVGPEDEHSKAQTSAAVNIPQQTGRGVTPPYRGTTTRKATVRVLSSSLMAKPLWRVYHRRGGRRSCEPVA